MKGRKCHENKKNSHRLQENTWKNTSNKRPLSKIYKKTLKTQQ